TQSGPAAGHMMSSLYPPSYMSVVSPHLEDGSIPVLLMEPLPRLFPFLPPLPPHRPLRVYDCPLEPAFIQRRNERERQRVRCVNQGFCRLRGHLPGRGAERRLSKVKQNQNQRQEQNQNLDSSHRGGMHIVTAGKSHRQLHVETLRAAIKYIQQLQGLVQRGGGALPVGPGTNN
ncbi:hypothetical protein NQZ68_034148, partial [Dissostichus eleginoides]